MGNIISSDRSIPPEQQQALRCLAGLMIPAQGELPAAADDLIFVEILLALEPHAAIVARALADLDEQSIAEFGSRFVELEAVQQQSLVEPFRQHARGFIQLFQTSVLACYYRDDRVLTAIGLPARAPFPQGHEVADTDWSLLDPVRAREPFFRPV